jgi:phosphatidylinositol dimannoside acyltransferase
VTAAGHAVDPKPRRGTFVQRARVRAIRAASWVVCHLPERVGVAFANVVGELWYRLAPARAAQARRNFARVATELDARGRGPAKARAAAHDPKALERLVRLGFRHDARYYLEILRVPSLTPAILDTRVVVETPEAVETAFDGGPVIFSSPHLGPIELPALYLATRTGRPFVGPMETVDDPPLQAWFEETRGALGVRIVGLREARRALQTALREDGYVGIVADRDIAGGGIDVPFFGAPAPFPIGPALLATETGARIAAVGVRRLPDGRYAGRLIPVPVATDGSRRERIAATLTSLAAAFEDLIADAPEQWSGAFFPIWADLAAGDDPAATHDAAATAGSAVPPGSTAGDSAGAADTAGGTGTAKAAAP